MSMPTERPMANNYVNRFFGGPPLSVIFRLILLSILIGVILEVLGLDPWNIIDSLRRLVLRVWDMGFDAVRWLWRYLLLGAAVVVPIWLVVRLMRVAKGQYLHLSLARTSAIFAGGWRLGHTTAYAGHVSAVIAAASAPTSSSILACPPRRSASNSSDLMAATSRSPWNTSAL